MPNKKQIIAVTVLGIAALMLGCKTNATGIGEAAGDHRELTLREKLVGTYERKRDAFTYRYVFLDNGKIELYSNGEKKVSVQKWSLVENELHIKSIAVNVYKINPDNSITLIAYIGSTGKRSAFGKVQQQKNTWKKIK